MAQRGSLSGRSPFCQRKREEVLYFLYILYRGMASVQAKARYSTLTSSLPESAASGVG